MRKDDARNAIALWFWRVSDQTRETEYSALGNDFPFASVTIPPAVIHSGCGLYMAYMYTMNLYVLSITFFDINHLSS